MSKLKVVYKAPFYSVGSALSYFNSNNPARAKYVNLLEPTKGQKPTEADFSGGAPSDIYASILAAVLKVTKGVDHDSYLAFVWRNIGDRDRHLAVEDIAQRLYKSLANCYCQRVRRNLNKIEESLKAELVRRELLEPDWVRAIDEKPPTQIKVVLEDFQGQLQIGKSEQRGHALIVRDCMSGQYRSLDEFCQWRPLKPSEEMIPIKFQ